LLFLFHALRDSSADQVKTLVLMGGMTYFTT
jgi:hypothetical protein